MAISLEVEVGSVRYEPMRAAVTEALKAALHFLSLDGAVSVALISDREMRRVNRERRGKDEPTTVLSFAECDVHNPVSRAAGPEAYLGEILLAPDTIARRGEEVVRFAVHGLLHLLGYTHDKERDSIEMERLEGRVLEHLRSVSKYVSNHHRT